jgi:hypothetical protein
MSARKKRGAAVQLSAQTVVRSDGRSKRPDDGHPLEANPLIFGDLPILRSLQLTSQKPETRTPGTLT